MKKIMGLLLGALLVSFASNSFAQITGEQVDRLDRMNLTARKYQLGTNLKYASEDARIVRGTYDFAVQGGASSAELNLDDRFGDDIVIPDNAVVTQVIIDVLTTADSAADGASVSIGLVSDGDLRASTVEASVTGLLAGTPVGTAGTSIKLSADNTPYVKITGEDLTAGKFDVFIEYLVGQ